MTKEELKQKADLFASIMSWDEQEDTWEDIAERAYIAGATEATKELEKENVELKDYRLTTLAKQQTGMSKYALNLEHKLSWYDDQLTKAKELLERLLITSCNSDVLNLLPNCSEVLRVRVEAEQFLSEVENV